ncbi:molybdate ABC transporter substrate-binding protein [Gilvimarinus sp. F26214L]|uniref:molybdate ABC transporter substrate-binding protein n=1 Tax=Gilvimarinus sp. DZF01 TaxID=3461371 RepID=UPI004045E4F0
MVIRSLLAFALLSVTAPLTAEEVLIAVASNFVAPMEHLAEAFEQNGQDKVKIASGSTGKLYAQIRSGAPFQILLAADQDSVARLIEEGRADAQSRLTYAKGILVLWSPIATLELGPQTLRAAEFRRLSIANPRLAPYGRAAQQSLQALGLWKTLQPNLVRGENINQAFQFVSSGNADLGLLALSQIVNRDGSYWRLPGELHQPIHQDAVLLAAGEESPGAKRFLTFLRSPRALRIIETFGYEWPGWRL